MPNAWVIAYQTQERIGGRVLDRVITAAFPAAFSDYIPDSDTVCEQRRCPLSIRSARVEREQVPHDLPEMVLPVPVILLLRERLLAGERAEDKDPRAVVDQR